MFERAYSTRTGLIFRALLCCLLFVGLSASISAQSIEFQRGVGREMLSKIKDRIKENYYDPALRKFDLDTQYTNADAMIKKASSTGEINAILAAFSLSLDDGHTWYFPPPRELAYDYGWIMQNIGEGCYVTAVRPGSDADKQGVKPGDEVLSVMDQAPTRDELWKIKYYIYFVSPQRVLKVSLRSPGGQPRQLQLATNVTRPFHATDSRDLNGLQRERVEFGRNEKRWDHRFYELRGETLIWRMPGFDRERADINELFGRARKFKSVIIDLRGNPGGAEETLLAVLSNLFDRDVKVGDLSDRKGSKPLIAKTRGNKGFAGKVILLVNAGSEESSELLARVIQLEKRGTVIGDRTAGKTLRDRLYMERMGAERVLIYGVMLPGYDVTMTDGKSLETVGVTPDELLLPTGEDLRTGRDPVLARACALAGIPLDSAQAGALFPYQWPE